MRKVAIALLVLVAIVGIGFTALVGYLYFTERTIDQPLATSFNISRNWTDITPDRALTEYRDVAELALAIPGYDHDPMDHLTWGNIRLPDGRIVTPEVEGIDENGNLIAFKHTGFTMSQRDLVIFTPNPDLDHDKKIKSIRLRSDEPFLCEEIFWRNRNLK